MYDLYVQKCNQENKPAVKDKYYYNVFHSKCNLHFKISSKDTCRLCDELYLKLRAKSDNDKKRTLDTQKTLHLARADQARHVLRSDKKKASELSACKRHFLFQSFQHQLPIVKETYTSTTSVYTPLI